MARITQLTNQILNTCMCRSGCWRHVSSTGLCRTSFLTCKNCTSVNMCVGWFNNFVWWHWKLEIIEVNQNPTMCVLMVYNVKVSLKYATKIENSVSLYTQHKKFMHTSLALIRTSIMCFILFEWEKIGAFSLIFLLSCWP